MLFGKYVNKYYLKYSLVIFIGIVALIAVDLAQLKIPEIYSYIIDGLNQEVITLTKTTLLSLCYEIFIIALVMVVGRMLW